MQDLQQFNCPLNSALMISNCQPELFHLTHTFMSNQWLLNNGISGSLERPFRCGISRKRPPELLNFGARDVPLVRPLNLHALFPSQFSLVFLNKINIWLAVGEALSLSQEKHGGKKKPRVKGERSGEAACISLISQDCDVVSDWI